MNHNGFEFIEIGGIKWATCNVGADKPTDMGLYFQWGDRKGYTADEVGNIKVFDRNHYKHHNGKHLTKYNGSDCKLVLDLRDDATFAYMGYGWRIPTREDFRCLIESTTRMWTKSYKGSGVGGMVLTDITDNTKELFFPAAGRCVNIGINSLGLYGFYWSSSLLSTGVLVAYCLAFNDGIVIWDNNGNRYSGFPIRGILTI